MKRIGAVGSTYLWDIIYSCGALHSAALPYYYISHDLIFTNSKWVINTNRFSRRYMQTRDTVRVPVLVRM